MKRKNNSSSPDTHNPNGTRAIVIAGYGTAAEEEGMRLLDALADRLQPLYPNFFIKKAFTSEAIIQILRKRGRIHIPTVAEAFDALLSEGCSHVCVLPLHLIPGFENQRLEALIKPYEQRFQTLVLVPPLLNNNKDLHILTRLLAEEFCDLPDRTAVLCMGHGSRAPANSVYSALNSICGQEGYPHFFIGTINASPGLTDLLPALKSGGFQNIILTPLLFMSGRHMADDMAGSKSSSWKSILERDGFTVDCRLRGLGEYDGIQQLFISRLNRLLPLFEGFRQGYGCF